MTIKHKTASPENEPITVFQIGSFKITIPLPKRMCRIIGCIIIILGAVSIWFLGSNCYFYMQGYPITLFDKTFSVNKPPKIIIKGVVILKGYPAEGVDVHLNDSKGLRIDTKKTSSDGMFMFPNIDPENIYNVVIESEYGPVKYYVENGSDRANWKGVVDLGELQATTNVALGKPVVFNFAKTEKVNATITNETSSKKIETQAVMVTTSPPQYYKIYSINKGYYPSNLTDGDETSMFSPAGYFLAVVSG